MTRIVSESDDPEVDILLEVSLVDNPWDFSIYGGGCSQFLYCYP